MKITVTDKSPEAAMIKPVPMTSSKLFIIFIIVSLPIMICGGWIMASALDLAPMDPNRITIPKNIFLIMGFCFLICGCLLFLNNTLNLLAFLKLKKFRFRYRDSPWYWDYNWNPKGDNQNFLKRLSFNFFIILLMFSMFTPGLYIAFQHRGFPAPLIIMIVIFSIIFLSLAFYQILKTLKFRHVKCQYHNFPFRLGENVLVQVEGLPNSDLVEKLSVNLRCLKYHLIKQGRKREHIASEIYTQEVPTDPINILNGILSLNIPTERKSDLSTDFTKENYICWELKVKAEVPGIDYNFGFIIPLYA